MKLAIRVFLFISITGVFFYVFLGHLIKHTPKKIGVEFIVSCQTIGKAVEIAINDEGFSPPIVSVQLCDRITFVNKGTLYHQVAFGDHEDHLLYPGYKERALKPAESISFAAIAFGDYHLHDHIYDELEGELVVEPLIK